MRPTLSLVDGVFYSKHREISLPHCVVQEWSNEMKATEEEIKKNQPVVGVDNLPPVRGAGSISASISEQQQAKTSSKKQRVTPRDYKDWDK